MHMEKFIHKGHQIPMFWPLQTVRIPKKVRKKLPSKEGK